METTVIRYPKDHFLDFPELQTLLQAATPQSGAYILLAESFSTP